jgi:hypothetical protein
MSGPIGVIPSGGLSMASTAEVQTGFCIYINTICEGPTPVESNGKGYPVVYKSILDAQRVIAEDTIERLRQFLEGERDFDDAMTVEEYIVAVDVLADGSIVDADGNCFGSGAHDLSQN